MDAGGVFAERVGIELGALEGLAGWVADAGSGAADECDGVVAAALEPGEDNEAEEVAEVEALGGGVEAAVDFDGAGGNGVVKVGAREGLEEAALLEDFDDVVAPRGLGLQLRKGGDGLDGGGG